MAPSPAQFASYAEALVPSLDPAGHVYSSYYQANTRPEGFVSLLSSDGDRHLVAHSPRRLDAIDARGQATELGTFSGDITSLVRQGAKTFVATAREDERGRIYLQEKPGGSWQVSLDSGKDSVQVVELEGAVFSLDDGGVVRRFRGGLWSEWAALDLSSDDETTEVVAFRGRLWVGTQSERRGRKGGRAALLGGLRNDFFSPRGRLKGEAKRDGEHHRVTALLEVGGQLFVATGARAEGDLRGGSLSALELSTTSEDELVELVSFRDDVPLSLAYHEGTVFVGTRRGFLYHLDPARSSAEKEKAKKGKSKKKKKKAKRPEIVLREERVPANQGVHSLLATSEGTLLIGVEGLVGAEVLRREGRTPRPLR